ncbi:MAG TPA: NADP-dependent oxidoreductase, partial [Lentzea sp.]
MTSTALEVRLAARPNGWPTEETFEIAEVDVPTPAEGQVLVRNVFMSVDPYMRGRMNDVKSYVPPFQVGQPLDGGAVGEVVAVGAGVTDLAVGDNVLHGLGWREYAVVPAAHTVKVDPNVAPLSAYLGVLGMPGLTAYAGLLATAEFKPGDVVFVSGAAGAVGQL